MKKYKNSNLKMPSILTTKLMLKAFLINGKNKPQVHQKHKTLYAFQCKKCT